MLRKSVPLVISGWIEFGVMSCPKDSSQVRGTRHLIRGKEECMNYQLYIDIRQYICAYAHIITLAEDNPIRA